MTSLPLIAAQPGIWLADKLSSFDNAYIVAHYVDLRGDVNVEHLCHAIMQAMNETDTLKMTYTDDDGVVAQLPSNISLPFPEVYDLRRDANPVESCNDLMRSDMNANVRIDSGNQLIRHVIMRLSDSTYRWYQRYHHIQLDAYSFTALTRRMSDLYSSSFSNTPTAKTQAPDMFANVVKEYNEYEISRKYEKDRQFWKEFCASLPEAASPSARPLNGEEPSKKIIRNSIDLDYQKFRGLCDALKAGSPSAGFQDADVGLALLATWLLRLTNKQAMSTGFIFMRRLGSIALNTSGPFINVLPMPIGLVNKNGQSETLGSLTQSLISTLKKVRRHQKYDSEKIVRDTGRSWEDHPLYGPVINFKAFDYRLDFGSGVESYTQHLASGPIRDIEFVLYITESGLVQIEYLANADRYDQKTLDRHLQRLPLLLDQFAADTLIKCEDAKFVLPEEQKSIEAANSTQHPCTGDDSSTLLTLLHESMKSNEKNKIALQDVDTALSYEQMHAQVTSLALDLKNRGVNANDIVAVSLSRSVLLSIALQAILTVGATWLPLDPSYPRDRLEMMITDSKPKIIITDSQWPLGGNGTSEGNEPEPDLYLLESLLPLSPEQPLDFSAPTPDSVAYIIYTSGSTGRPKGVKVSHRAIVNRLKWMQQEYRIHVKDVTLQKTPSSFDVSVWEFFLPLISGSRLVMAPPGADRDPETLLEIIIKFKVTTIHFVPSMLAAFLNNTDAKVSAKTLKRVFCSGEALSISLATRWQNNVGVPLYNLYGPTEAAIDVTAYPAFGSTLKTVRQIAATYSMQSIPIGRPVWNTQVHVLDSNFRLLPSGTAGDLYLSGVQLAEGYLNREELTKERFIEINGVRMYRTGDVARWINDIGALEFLGRSDDQVKLRGQRIELGEIDAVMERLPGVAQAVTQPQVFSGMKASQGDEDARQLVSYLVLRDPKKPLQLDTIHEQLMRALPAYMVPAKLVVLESLPLSSSGKLDRKALPLPTVGDTSSKSDDQSRRAPASGLEQTIADAYKEVLGFEEDLRAEDDFFSLGGHSLLAVRLAAVLRNKLHLPVNIGQIMQTPRISELAGKLSDASDQESWRNAGYEKVLPLRQSRGRAPKKIFCVHPASGFSWQFSVLGRYLDEEWSLVGIQSAGTDDILAQSESLDDVTAAHYETVVQEQPEGPYYLLGYSLGGTLAHALAAKLASAGRQVAFLGLLDTWPPETQNWDEKRGKNVVDEAVIEEMYRERQQFIDAQKGAAFESDGMSNRLFDIIESNYSSAVRLLATAKSHRFEGTSTLFVAERTFPAGTDLQEIWRPWTQRLNTVPVDSSHVDIISPQTFKSLGPQLNMLLRSYL